MRYRNGIWDFCISYYTAISNPSVGQPTLCGTCAVASLQAQLQVSRRPAQRADKPFERVRFIHVNPAFNGRSMVISGPCISAVGMGRPWTLG